MKHMTPPRWTVAFIAARQVILTIAAAACLATVIMIAVTPSSFGRLDAV